MEAAMENVTQIMKYAIEQQASDLFIVAGRALTCKINGEMVTVGEEKMMPEDTDRIIKEIYELAGSRSMEKLMESGDDDFSFALHGMSRFRVSTYKQRGSLAAVIRIIAFSLPNPAKLGIPEEVIHQADGNNGLVLVTGTAGSGKSTTLACMIDHINQTRAKHIITLEDPLEFVHRHEKSIVSQREVNTDTESYLTALRAALRQSPDVILLGEMRDYETIHTAMTAAETGHLIFSTLHTLGAANTVDRIIDVFPANQQRQITIQLASVLQAIVSQQLVPDVDGRQIPAFEIMTMTPAIRTMIRENKVHQIDGVIYSSSQAQLMSMDNCLLNYYRQGKITKETALTYAVNGEMMARKLPK